MYPVVSLDTTWADMLFVKVFGKRGREPLALSGTAAFHLFSYTIPSTLVSLLVSMKHS